MDAYICESEDLLESDDFLLPGAQDVTIHAALALFNDVLLYGAVVHGVSEVEKITTSVLEDGALS